MSTDTTKWDVDYSKFEKVEDVSDSEEDIKKVAQLNGYMKDLEAKYKDLELKAHRCRMSQDYPYLDQVKRDMEDLKQETKKTMKEIEEVQKKSLASLWKCPDFSKDVKKRGKLLAKQKGKYCKVTAELRGSVFSFINAKGQDERLYLQECVLDDIPNTTIFLLQHAYAEASKFKCRNLSSKKDWIRILEPLTLNNLDKPKDDKPKDKPKDPPKPLATGFLNKKKTKSSRNSQPPAFKSLPRIKIGPLMKKYQNSDNMYQVMAQIRGSTMGFTNHEGKDVRFSLKNCTVKGIEHTNKFQLQMDDCDHEFEASNSHDQKDWIIAIEKIAKKKSTTFTLGQHVKCNWKSYGKFYQGRIAAVMTDNTYFIKYDIDDSIEKNVVIANIVPIEVKYTVGQHVKCKWIGRYEYYDAKIEAVTGETYTVRYDVDGSLEENVVLENLDVKTSEEEKKNLVEEKKKTEIFKKKVKKAKKKRTKAKQKAQEAKKKADEEKRKAEQMEKREEERRRRKKEKFHEVKEWLESLALDKYAQIFEEKNYSNMNLIKRLNDAGIKTMLRSIGFTPEEATTIKKSLAHFKEEKEKVDSLPGKKKKDPLNYAKWLDVDDDDNVEKVIENSALCHHCSLSLGRVSCKECFQVFCDTCDALVHQEIKNHERHELELNLPIGERVILGNFTKHGQYNGMSGKIVHVTPDDTFHVEMDIGGKVVNRIPRRFLIKESRIIEKKNKNLASEMSMLSIGTHVILKGLKGTSKYNGQHGTIFKSYSSTTGRYGIKLDDGGKQLAIRPINITLMKKKNEVDKEKRNVTSTEEIKQFAAAYGLKKSDKVWNLTSKNISVKECIIISDLLKNNSKLQSLWLQGNKIDDEGANEIAESLTHNHTLASLELNHNLIGDEGASTLGKSLKCNSTLTELNLGENMIGNEGATVILESLKANGSLRELFLNYNKIGNAGAQHIGEALKVNAGLKKLYLDNNEIGDKGAQLIVEALKENQTIKQIYLKSNNISKEVANRIKITLKDHSSIQTGYLPYMV